VTFQSLKNQAYQLVGCYVPKNTFYHFTDPNPRMLVAVTCLQFGYTDIAYSLFETIVQEGPQTNANHHFAYVRSLVEMAEIDAGQRKYKQAVDAMTKALAEYPTAMSYMISRVHLEVYVTYYMYQAGDPQQARDRIAMIYQRERARFAKLPLQDARCLVGPGLCYAIHQWALFDGMEGNWEGAWERAKEMLPFVSATNPIELRKAEKMWAEGKTEQAFLQWMDAIQYLDSE
jgi:tetratricopeptide (TPR) repeat protein